MSENQDQTKQSPFGVLLIVDDDDAFRNQLVRAMSRRRFDVVSASCFEEAKEVAKNNSPDYAVLDIQLGDGNGMDLVPILREMHPDIRIVMLTGYGNLASAVSAIKVGAVDYLAKPADADNIAQALVSQKGALPPPPENPMSVDRVKWEHIQRVYEQCNRNVSETARRLNMHRRSLQRILAKKSPK